MHLSGGICYIGCMKDYFNPLLLLLVVGLSAWGMNGDREMALWCVCMCVSLFFVNGALCLARVVTRRPALMVCVWSVAYLILGSCAWVMYTAPETDCLEEEKAAFAEQLKGWRETGLSPFVSADRERDCLVVLAAGLGKHQLLHELLLLPEAAGNMSALQLAARSAVENNRLRSLRLLLEHGVSADAVVQGTPLLGTAVIHGCQDSVQFLLEQGANPNLPDADGVPLIMHAVINDDLVTAQLLMRYGVNPLAKDADGRDAPSCSRTAEMDAVLSRKPD